MRIRASVIFSLLFLFLGPSAWVFVDTGVVIPEKLCIPVYWMEEITTHSFFVGFVFWRFRRKGEDLCSLVQEVHTFIS
jgi:hypothetical protein